MDIGLGRFGDRRLEKGGPFFWGALLSWAVARCGCVGWAAPVRARFG
jgi:hypothetical protein